MRGLICASKMDQKLQEGRAEEIVEVKKMEHQKSVNRVKQ